MGKLATSPLPYRGSPPLRSGGQSQKWSTSGQIGYLTPAVSGIPASSERGAKSEVAHNWANWLPHPCRIGGPTAAERGAKSEVAHKWANWLPHPCRIGDPHRCRARGKIRSGPQVGKMATSSLPYRGSPPLQSGGQNQKWPTSGQIGYLTHAVSGIPTAAERGAKSEMAHKWANWLPHPCRIGDPRRCKAGGKIRSGPQGGKNWLPHPCRIGDPRLFRAGGKIRSGPQLGKLATSPLPYRGAHRCRAGGKIRSGPQVGKLATSPVPYRGSPPLQSGGQNQKWPTSGQIGYLTPAVSGIPAASERGAKLEVAHKWANWLPHPCRIGDPRRHRAGGKIRSGPQVGKLATSPLPCRGSPPLQSGGQNQKWPTSGEIGYLTPAVSGIPAASERGGKSEVANKWAKWLPHPCRIGDPHRCRAGGKSKVAHKWANWLPHPCRLGDPHRCRAGSKIRSGPQVGKLATPPLPPRGSPPLQSWGQSQKWPTSGQIGYLTPAVSGIPTAAERGAKSEVAHKWANWLPDPCRIGDPRRFKAGGKIRSGPQVGRLATSPLPYRGSPPLQSRGAKSEVAHKWANWLPHPCRIGDPRRFRAGGKIRSGP